MKKVILLVVALLVTVFVVSGCGSGPKVGPSSTIVVPEPVPALAGTNLQDQPIQLPESSQPLVLFIQNLNPGLDGIIGSNASISWNCQCPAGYEIWISDHFVPDGWPDPEPTDISSGEGGRPCEAIQRTSGLPPTLAGLPIKKVHFSVWVAPKGSRIGIPNRPADAVRDQVLNWRVSQ